MNDSPGGKGLYLKGHEGGFRDSGKILFIKQVTGTGCLFFLYCIYYFVGLK